MQGGEARLGMGNEKRSTGQLTTTVSMQFSGPFDRI